MYPEELEIKDTKMIQTGLIIFTLMWSLMRMVDFTHEIVMTFGVWCFCFTAYGVFVSQLIRC